MLKIKKEKLEELKNYGFYETPTTYLIKWMSGEEICVFKKTRAIRILGNFANCEFYNSDILYDLIKADLVEKVDDK